MYLLTPAAIFLCLSGMTVAAPIEADNREPGGLRGIAEAFGERSRHTNSMLGGREAHSNHPEVVNSVNKYNNELIDGRTSDVVKKNKAIVDGVKRHLTDRVEKKSAAEDDKYIIEEINKYTNDRINERSAGKENNDIVNTVNKYTDDLIE